VSVQQVNEPVEVCKRGVQLLLADEFYADAVFDAAYQLASTEPVQVPATFEDEAIDAVAESIAVRRGEETAAVRLEHTSDPGKRLIHACDVFESVMTDDEVEAGVAEGDLVSASADCRMYGEIFVELYDCAGVDRGGEASGAGAEIVDALAGRLLPEPVVDVEIFRHNLAIG
jgi:hypothetical protein